MGRGFTIATVHRDSAAYVEIEGELDLATAPLLAQQLQGAEATRARLIVVDLAGVPFIDSTGLRALLEAHTRSQGNGNRLRIVGHSEQARRLFELTGVLDELPLRSSSEDLVPTVSPAQSQSATVEV